MTKRRTDSLLLNVVGNPVKILQVIYLFFIYLLYNIALFDLGIIRRTSRLNPHNNNPFLIFIKPELPYNLFESDP